MATLTDHEIQALIAEPKAGAERLRGQIRWFAKRQHKQAHIKVRGKSGNEFGVHLRQNSLNALDFSVILVYCPPETCAEFRLTRYNGKHGEHTNSIERVRFYDFHIHRATARYQERGSAEDAYAERTARYATLADAVECLIADCGFASEPDAEPSLFGPEDFG